MKLLYCFPAFLYGGLLATIGFSLGFGAFAAEAWVYLILLTAAAILLIGKKWWGCIPGMAVGVIVIGLFQTTSAHQHVNVTPLGIGIVLYFAAMGVICFRLCRGK